MNKMYFTYCRHFQIPVIPSIFRNDFKIIKIIHTKITTDISWKYSDLVLIFRTHYEYF